MEDCQARALDQEGFTPLASSMAELEALGIMLFEVPLHPSASPPPEIHATTPTATTSNVPKTTATTSNIPKTTAITSNVSKTTAATTTLEQHPTAHALATSEASKAQTSPEVPETQRSLDAQPARAAGPQSAPAPMEGVDPSAKQPSRALEGVASASGGRNTPLQRTPSPQPQPSPSPTPPPHSLFSIPKSPLLQQSPPASPSRDSQQGDRTRLSQKRKDAATDENGEGSVGTAAVRPTKKLRGKSAQAPTLPKATTPLSDRPRRTRASGADQTPLAASQLAGTSGTTAIAAIPLASTSPNPLTTAKPAWFTSAASMMRGKALGTQWIQLVNTWEAFEVKSDFTESKKLPTTRHPEAVKAWIQRARAPAWRPTITDTAAYEADFKSWWAALQPSWRKSSSGDVVFSRVDGDWEDVCRPGLNGMLSVMAGLFFWGVALGKHHDGQRGWKQAVSDCQVTLNALC